VLPFPGRSIRGIGCGPRRTARGMTAVSCATGGFDQCRMDRSETTDPARQTRRQQAHRRDSPGVERADVYTEHGCQWRAIPKDLPPRSTVHDYLERWTWDGTLKRIHYVLYVKCREQASREASPTAAVIDAQSLKSAEKGGPRSTHTATMRARRSRARSATCWSIAKVCCSRPS
jgi:transposase